MPGRSDIKSTPSSIEKRFQRSGITNIHFNCDYTYEIQGQPGGVTYSGYALCIENGRYKSGLCSQDVETCFDSCAIRNPISVATAQKRQADTDWRSPKEPRFEFVRYYSQRPVADPSILDRAHGHGWSNPYLKTISAAPGNGSSWRYMYSSIYGQRFAFADYPTFLPETKDHDLVYSYQRSTITDKTGKVEYFGWGYEEFSRIEKIGWPDGYELDLIYQWLQGTYIPIAITDNRGQRANITWGRIDPSTNLPVMEKIEIDTDYDGTNFSPEVAIDYTYRLPTASDWDSILELISATTTDVSSGKILSQRTYDYVELDAGRALSHTFDGTRGELPGVDQSNVPSGSYAYSSGRAVSTEYAGGVEKFQRAMVGNAVVMENPLGKKTKYYYQNVAKEPKLTRVEGEATASCLGSVQSLGYTPNAGAPEGYVYERTERNGSHTTYTRNERGLILTKTEDAGGIAPRVTTYTLHPDRRLPLTRANKKSGISETYEGYYLV